MGIESDKRASCTNDRLKEKDGQYRCKGRRKGEIKRQSELEMRNERMENFVVMKVSKKRREMYEGKTK